MADSVGSVSVDVVPDARGWSEKLRAQLRDVTVNVPVDADTAKATAKLDKLGAESPEVKVDVDDAEATTKLTLIQGQVDALDGKTANVKVKADKSQVSQATSALDGFLSKIGLLPALALTAGSALIPLGAAIGGVAAALAAPLAIAGGGVGLFAVLGGLAVKNTEKQLKDISKFQTKLDGLKKGTKEYADTQKQLKMATDALSPAQDRLSKAQGNLKESFTKLTQGKAGEALLDPIAQGMNLLAGILPRLTPLITAVSGALTSLLGGVAKATSGPGFGKLIGQLSRQVGPDIEAFGHIIGEVSKGIGGLLLTLGKSSFSGGLLDGLERMGSAFSDWANSKQGRQQVHDFLAYVQSVGPQIVSTIGHIAHAFVRIGEALAPLGPGVLDDISGMADAISAIPVDVLTKLAEAVGALILFNKVGGFKATGAISRAFAGAKTGGLAGGVTSALGKGVTPVEVMNWPPGMLTGGGGGGVGAGAAGAAGAAGGAAARGFGALGLGLSKFPSAAEVLKTGGALARFGGSVARFGEIIGAPAFVGTGGDETGSHPGPRPGTRVPNIGTPVILPAHGPVPTRIPRSFAMPGSDVAVAAMKSATAMDGLRGAAAQASHQIDQLGPQAVQASAQAVGAFHRAQAALDAIHDKRIQIIVDTGSLISRMQAINNMIIHDKTFTITQINRVVEQNVGPGGGAHRLPTTLGNATGGWIHGPGSGTSDSIPSWLSNGEFVVNAAAAAANRDWLNQINNSRRAPGYAMGGPVRAASSGPVHVTVVGHVDEDGYITGTSQDVYAANNDFDRAHG